MKDLQKKTAEELMLLYQTDSPGVAYEAFTELYNRYSAKVYDFIKKKTLNSFDSDDLLQKVFIKIHESKHLYSEKYKFDQWIFVIAKTQILDYFRSNKRYGARILKNELYENSEKTDVSLPELESDQRELLEMKFIDELSYHEIALILNKSEVSLRKTVSRLIGRLKNGVAL